MKLADKLRDTIDSVGNLHYSYIVGGRGVYIKSIRICVRRKPGNFGWKQQHRVTFFFLGTRGKETERLYKECDLMELESGIHKGEFVPIEDGFQTGKLLPQRILIAKVLRRDNKVILVRTVGNKVAAYIGTIKGTNILLPSGWVTCSLGSYINCSSYGWRMSFCTYPTNNTVNRVRFTLEMDFRTITREELMEFLV